MNGVVYGIREGEVLILPCGRCASVSVRLVVRVGDATPSCPKCQARIRFQIGLGPGGFRIRSRPESEGPAVTRAPSPS